MTCSSHWPNCNWCDTRGNGKVHHASSAEDWEDGEDIQDGYDGSNNYDSEEPSSSDLTTVTSTDIFNDPFDPLNEPLSTTKDSTEAINSLVSSSPTPLSFEDTALVYSAVDVIETQMGLGPLGCSYTCAINV